MATVAANDRRDDEDKMSSGTILASIRKSEDSFREWNSTCHDIDDIYSLHGTGLGWRSILGTDAADGWADTKLDLFWSSYEVMKPAVYAKPPIPAVAPLFQDNKPLLNVTAEVLERATVSTFTRTGIDDVMVGVRDDLLFTNRGVMWLTYEAKDGKKVCVEHIDRLDFTHEPARKWSEVGWVARRAWMSRDELAKRFKPNSGDAHLDVKLEDRGDDRDERYARERKAGVWEVWHKANNRVYWVGEGCDVFLDEGEPHLKLDDFWPCPRPAYGTLRRRALIPVPDWERYAIHFAKISELTGRIYLLLNSVKMRGLVAGGGDVADAVDEMLRSDDDQIVIRVPSMATDANSLVAWLPLNDVASAIQGLIEARGQLIEDFYQLSGISDIMRGATEAEETLGAQQLKSQYGSVRVRQKIDELQRIAADAVKIAAEIIADKFDQKTLLEMAQMDLPTKADIEKRIKKIEEAAEAELKALSQKAQEKAQEAQQPLQGGQAPQIDPAQAEQALQQAQQQIIGKYAAMLREAEQQVPIEDVMKLLRDEKARSFAFEIESDSTILTDELQEKASRNEFASVLVQSMGQLPNILQLGQPAIELWGELTKFQCAPFRAGRSMDGAIDRFIDAAPEIAKAAVGGDDNAGLAEANNKLAEAEQVKAQAAMEGVKARAAQDQANNQAKMTELQQKAANDAAKAAQDNQKLQLQLAEAQEKARLAQEKQQAEIDNLTAQTAKILASIGLDERKQNLSEYTAASNEQAKAVDQQMAAQGQEQDAQFRSAEHERADRQQDFSERSGEHQMTLAERQAQQGDR